MLAPKQLVDAEHELEWPIIVDRTVNKISRTGSEVVLLDGTLVRTRRRSGGDNRRHYSGQSEITTARHTASQT